jgi:uncharacterized membrane protein
MINFYNFKHTLSSYFRLKHEEKEVETYHEITAAAEFSGFNLWILGFAMVIACIGLNTDSTSAVIGAMLISPLMGPIIGYAFAIAIQDRRLNPNYAIDFDEGKG